MFYSSLPNHYTPWVPSDHNSCSYSFSIRSLHAGVLPEVILSHLHFSIQSLLVFKTRGLNEILIYSVNTDLRYTHMYLYPYFLYICLTIHTHTHPQLFSSELSYDKFKTPKIRSAPTKVMILSSLTHLSYLHHQLSNFSD